jgi:hypothetical protein
MQAEPPIPAFSITSQHKGILEEQGLLTFLKADDLRSHPFLDLARRDNHIRLFRPISEKNPTPVFRRLCEARKADLRFILIVNLNTSSRILRK